MPTPKAGYFLADGSRVPGVTTVLDAAKESGGLMHWAWNIAHGGLLEARALLRQAKDGEPGVNDKIAKFLSRPLDDWSYRVKRDKAADAGTMAHAAVDAWIHGENFAFEGDPDVCSKAKVAFGAFLEWADQTQLKVTHTEMPLVSEKHKFGGTFDAIMVRGKRSMGDWKTSNATYPEYMMQVAAYGQLWMENRPDEPIEGGYHLLRFDKEQGDFHHHWWGNLDTAWEAFLLLRRLYEIKKELKKRAA